MGLHLELRTLQVHDVVALLFARPHSAHRTSYTRSKCRTVIHMVTGCSEKESFFFLNFDRTIYSLFLDYRGGFFIKKEEKK